MPKVAPMTNITIRIPTALSERLNAQADEMGLGHDDFAAHLVETALRMYETNEEDEEDNDQQ